jgi:prepilin-type N-terminal cleavage/methylation domain-containing protein
VTSHLHIWSRRRRSFGFTLIELLMVVVIVGVSAALATPLLLGQMRERRSRDMAQQIAQLYTGARLRAMGRGTAVRVNFDASSGFRVLEATTSVAANAECAPNPGSGCLTTAWSTNSREVSRLSWPSDFTIQATKKGGTAVTNLNVCFSPGGRSFAEFTPADPRVALTEALGFSVKREGGLSRKVAVLPNGHARLAL